MKVLLDTHLYLWVVNDDKNLTKNARSFISSASTVFVSSASIWEISIKTKLGKLDANVDELVLAIEKSGFAELPITANHAAYVSQLPDYHRDPFDRMLISQALYEPLQFLTSDATLAQYSELVKLV